MKSKLLIGILLASFVLHAKQKNPNIILVMIDDCSAVEFSCYATTKHPAGNKTPVIDNLAQEGLQFETCWATPLCMPTRSLLISGKYGANTGVYGNRLNKPTKNFTKVHVPISKRIKDAGYETAISGKWHLPGNVEDPAYGWDSYSLLGGYMTPMKEVLWDGRWFSWSKASHTFLDTAIIGKNKGRYPALYWHGAVYQNEQLLPSDENTYAPDLNQKFALDFIRKAHDKPFFLYYPMVLPHDPFLSTPVGNNTGHRTKPGFNSLVQRMEYYMDELITSLKEEGLYENTILFFTADNATLANGKGSCSELGVRVPLIVAGGALKAKGTTDVLVDFSDMYPTLLECAGVQPKKDMKLDGQSFYPLLTGKKYKEKDFIFSYLDMQRTIRNKTHMMDGTGGVWKCSANGNVLDYEALPENEETIQIRQNFSAFLEQYPIPSPEVYGKERIAKASQKFTWPTLHYSMVKAIKQQDEWINNERRKRE